MRSHESLLLLFWSNETWKILDFIVDVPILRTGLWNVLLWSSAFSTWISGEQCDSVPSIKKIIFFFHVKQPRQMSWKRPSHKYVQNLVEDFEELSTISISMEVVELILWKQLNWTHNRWMWWGSGLGTLFFSSHLKVLIFDVVMHLMMFWCFLL